LGSTFLLQALRVISVHFRIDYSNEGLRGRIETGFPTTNNLE